MQTEKQAFKQWAIVELFGHQKIAGFCTEENIAGTNMLRVDVPETKSQQAFTRYFGSAAIYAINPVDQATATMAAQSIQSAPVQVWQAEEFVKKLRAEEHAREEVKQIAMLTEDDDDDPFLNPDF